MELPGTRPNKSDRLAARCIDFVPDQIADDAGVRVVERDSTAKRMISILADEPGDGARVALEFYLEFLKRVIGTAQQGGSLLFDGQFPREAVQLAGRYPAALFRELDKSWQDYAQRIEGQSLPFSVPPVLGMILSRSARRDAIPYVIRDLRDEWAASRRTVWHLLDSLRTARSFGEALEIEEELSGASKLFALEPTETDSRPIRFIWEMVAAAGAGVLTSAVLGAKPHIGAITGVVAQVARSAPEVVQKFGGSLFGRGAFDLARRVRRGVSRIELEALPRLLSESEQVKLGLK
jgi:hypothetical protein